jgi:hypothetical protein
VALLSQQGGGRITTMHHAEAVTASG